MFHKNRTSQPSTGGALRPKRRVRRSIAILTTIMMMLPAIPMTASAAGAFSPAATTAETCKGKAATVTASPGGGSVIVFVGTPGDDVIIGTNQSDYILGLGGNDLICGMGGADFLFGGDGNDWIYGNSHVTQWSAVPLQPGTTYATPPRSIPTPAEIAYVHAPGTANIFGDQQVDYRGTQAAHTSVPYWDVERMWGGNGNDMMFGSGMMDNLRGGAGRDFMYGWGGGDKLEGGTGFDFFYGFGGSDACYDVEPNEWSAIERSRSYSCEFVTNATMAQAERAWQLYCWKHTRW